MEHAPKVVLTAFQPFGHGLLPYLLHVKVAFAQVEDVEVIKTEYTDLPKEFYLNQLPNFNKYNFKDPLNLLNNNFSNINFNDFKNTKVSYIKDGSKILIKKKYIVNSITPVLYEYGIPHDAFLETINLYSTDKLMLLKDEFIFDNLIVTRNYRYLDSLIKEIKIIVTSGKKTLRSDIISFIYK